ncbi:MAG TPA: citrate/2-methylcitrate synthase [Actinocrinis sp.]|jgi:citrate synthase
MPDQPVRLSTRQVADLLGVKPETVYAYVSRGLLHSRREPRDRGSWFDSHEVEDLARHSRQAAANGGRPPQPFIATRLTLSDGGLYYRGRDAAQLAATESFENVAGLLWTGEIQPVDFAADAAVLDLVRTVTAAMPKTARLPDLLRVVPPVVAAADPLRFDVAPDSVRAAAAGLLAIMVDSLPMRRPGARSAPRRPAAQSLAQRLWPRLTARAPTPAGIRALNATLILLADHGLAVSTLAGRVAASARAHPYAVVSAALGAFDGPLHGAAGSHAYRLFEDALRDGDPMAVYAQRLRTQGRVEGFGHRTYPDGDPRARVLLGLLDEAGDEVPRRVRDTADVLVATARTRSPGLPNIDFALPLFAHAYDMAPDAGEAVFIVARTVGWIAHALEEYEETPMRFRYEGAYRGVEPPG